MRRWGALAMPPDTDSGARQPAPALAGARTPTQARRAGSRTRPGPWHPAAARSATEPSTARQARSHQPRRTHPPRPEPRTRAVWGVGWPLPLLLGLPGRVSGQGDGPFRLPDDRQGGKSKRAREGSLDHAVPVRGGYALRPAPAQACGGLLPLACGLDLSTPPRPERARHAGGGSGGGG
jgi:hypothetical protein